MVRQLFRYGIGIFALLLYFATIPAIATLAAETDAIITGDNVNFRASADTNSEVFFKLSKDEKVVLIETQGDWSKIVARSKEGYVFQDYIKATAAPKENEPLKESNTQASPFKTKVIVNGQQLRLEFEPPMENSRILVPFRAISEALNITVTWNAAEQQVIAIDQLTNKQIIFTINELNAIVNNEVVPLDAPPKLVNARTVLPLRFFSEQFGASVGWDQATSTATVTRVVEVEKVVEEVKSVSTPINLEGFSVVVTSDILNVRQGPSTIDPIVAKLLKGQTAIVVGSNSEWLKIQIDQVEGFIHSGYVEIIDYNGQSIRGFVTPSYEKEAERSILSWAKLGSLASKTEQVDNLLTVTTNANVMEEIDLVNEFIEKVDYEVTEEGTNIYILLRDEYTSVTYNTFDKLTIVFTEKSISGKRIVIDAGHGSQDPGAVANGLQEKEIVLDVSLRLQKLLEAEGIEVLMTRSDDTFFELSERVQFANANFADAFISIHSNAAENKSANGTETFWNATYNGKESKKLAQDIQARLLKKLATFDRGVKEANFHVIKNTVMPSVLVELAFVTNQEDAIKLASNEFRQKSAEAIFEGIMEFYK